MQKIGLIGNGSWATALAKILTENNHQLNWWFRDVDRIEEMYEKGINPVYLSQAEFDMKNISLSGDINNVVVNSEIILIAVPSAFLEIAFESIDGNALKNKVIISAVKGILPGNNELLNEFLSRKYSLEIDNYFTLIGPSHAEEVAAERLTYLTFSGLNENATKQVASLFENDYIKTRINNDVNGVQYAAVLKNIYALGNGILTGLDYGDNFQSVFIANCAREMENFINKIADFHNEIDYAVSVYLGDLLVTCYSLYSRNRMFGSMIGKGYSVRAAKLEMNMEAEGYNASKCIFEINKQKYNCEIPIVEAVYKILWEGFSAKEVFRSLEYILK